MKIATGACAGASLLLLALPAAAQIACADLASAYRAPRVARLAPGAGDVNSASSYACTTLD